MGQDWLSNLMTDLEAHHEAAGDRLGQRRIRILQRLALMFGIKKS